MKTQIRITESDLTNMVLEAIEEIGNSTKLARLDALKRIKGQRGSGILNALPQLPGNGKIARAQKHAKHAHKTNFNQEYKSIGDNMSTDDVHVTYNTTGPNSNSDNAAMIDSYANDPMKHTQRHTVVGNDGKIIDDTEALWYNYITQKHNMKNGNVSRSADFRSKDGKTYLGNEDNVVSDLPLSQGIGIGSTPEAREIQRKHDEIVQTSKDRSKPLPLFGRKSLEEAIIKEIKLALKK